ncbi:CsiV family protein [uncultured Legionella sp.]|uniref:CsiV family protein n=1 Tax=uncultured Legionella sp. TaxID=210934 RepID=UPI00260D0C75|nr:CsiV family protein [uncultured Legionella sp.]
MYRLLIVTLSILYSSFTLAKSSYQIDVIFFAHPQAASATNELDLNSPLIPVNSKGITLKSSTGKSSNSYELLPASQSGLSNEYYLLSRKSHYQVLGHYSWRQPANNQSQVTLPTLNNKGWIVQGSLRVRKSNYYLLDTDLQASPASNPQSSFAIVQKQRLKGSEVYYLDHPQAGMIIKIHSVA